MHPHEEFLSWLAEYEIEHLDIWDEELERDSQPGGRLDSVIEACSKRQLCRKDKADR